MSEDMDTKGIYFDLQSKTKSGNAVEFASIGIWEVDDTSLDWFTFKPYLCQALGNLGNISISYVDSDGDEIPIDSDLEFQEALKFARRKAAFQQKIVLKVEKLDEQAAAASGGMVLLNNPIYLKSSNFFKERLKINSGSEDHDALHASSGEAPVRVSSASCKLKTKPKSKDMLCPLQNCDSPPLWFKKYMKKMKSEIISEVTANVNSQMKKILQEIGQKAQPVIFPSTSMTPNTSRCCESNAWIVTKTKKKASDGESSSDGAPKLEIRDSKILRKIEKLDRRERKLDHKKEKLEQKTRKIAERKERECLSRLRLELAGCKGSRMDRGHFSKLRETEVASVPKKKVSVCELIQNPIPPAPLENPPRAPIGVTVNNDDMRMMTVKRNSNFTKIWKVTNSGGLQWTDETEVKLSWGNAGLTPEVSSMKCPPLAPGEEGEIAVSFTSPMFPGVFESHWHFYHNNFRFGGRLSCVVSVDLIQRDEEANGNPRSQIRLSPSSSVEFIVVHPTSVGDDGSYDTAGNKDLEVDLGIIPEAAPSESTNNDEPSDRAEGFSLASGPWTKDQKFSAEDKCLCSGGKDDELNSLSTDGFSGSDQSLGSDSDENFVVVPMPPCFRIDIPLASAVTPETIAVQKEECVAETEMPSVNEAPELPKQLPSAPPLEPFHPREGSSSQSPVYSHLSGIPLQREVSHDTGEVISVPLIPPQPKPSASPFQPAVTQLPLKCKTPLPRVIILNKQSPLSSPVATQRASSPTKSSGDPSPTSDHTYASSSSSSSKSAPLSSPENERRSERGRGSERPANIPCPDSNPRSSPSSSRPIDLRPPQSVSEVINGAINVTSSAINTAFAAAESFLENPWQTLATPGTVYRESPDSGQQRSRRVNREDPPPPPIDAVMADSLRKLANMGFVDLELNQALLRVYNHDLTQVIEALLNGKP